MFSLSHLFLRLCVCDHQVAILCEASGCKTFEINRCLFDSVVEASREAGREAGSISLKFFLFFLSFFLFHPCDDVDFDCYSSAKDFYSSPERIYIYTQQTRGIRKKKSCFITRRCCLLHSTVCCVCIYSNNEKKMRTIMPDWRYADTPIKYTLLMLYTHTHT